MQGIIVNAAGATIGSIRETSFTDIISTARAIWNDGTITNVTGSRFVRNNDGEPGEQHQAWVCLGSCPWTIGLRLLDGVWPAPPWHGVLWVPGTARNPTLHPTRAQVPLATDPPASSTPL